MDWDAEVVAERVTSAIQDATDNIDEYTGLDHASRTIPIVEDADLTVRVHVGHGYSPKRERETKERAAGFVALLVGADEVSVV